MSIHTIEVSTGGDETLTQTQTRTQNAVDYEHLRFPGGSSVTEVRPQYIRHRRAKQKPLWIKEPSAAYRVFSAVWDKDTIDYQESMYMLLLSASSELLGFSYIGAGSVNHYCVNIQKILTLALGANAVSIILAHNHPSGSVKVSEADKMITKRLFECTKLVGLTLLDHLILVREEVAPFGVEPFVSLHNQHSSLFIDNTRSSDRLVWNK